MRKKNINFAEQFKNSEQFLQKLENVKKASQNIKQKNKLTVHRNIWVKQQRYLSRLQRDSEIQFATFFDNFDKYFHYEYQERKIFENNDFKSYKQMRENNDNQAQIFQNNLFKQIESLPLLLEKCQSTKNKQTNFNEIQLFLSDITDLLKQVESQLHKQHEQINNSFGNQQIIEDIEEGYQDIVYYLKPISDEVKGFDFKKDRIKKVEQGQTHLLEYLQNFKEKLTTDEIFQVIEQFNHASNLLHETVELEIQKINLDYEQSLKFDHQAIKNSQTYQKFLHIYQIYIGRGKSLIQYYERLTIEFPKISKKNLEGITKYIQAKIYKQKKIKATKRNYLRQKQELFYKVEKQVNLRIQKKIKDAQKQAQQLMRRQQKLKLEKQLQLLRADYNIRQQQKLKVNQAIQQQKKNQQRKKEAIRKLYLDDLSKRAQQVKQIKQQKTKQQQLDQKIKRQKQQLEKKKKIAQIQPKIKERQSIDRKKIQKKLQIKEYKEKQKQFNEERIKQAVQHYPFRPQVEFSEQRLNAPTQSLTKKKQTLYDKADKIQLSKKTGYSVQQLMGDMRFRLNTALQEAGLANTQYARQLIVQMSKKP